MSSRKGFMPPVNTKSSFLSTAARAALACVALLATLAALAAGPAFANDDETIIEAGLSGPVLNGQTPVGKAVYRQRPGNDLKLQVEVQGVNLPAGTVLTVFVGGQQFATLTVDAFRAGRVEHETERGQAVPFVTNGTPVAVRNSSGANIVTGAFGSAAPTPTPGATPNATPTPGATPSPSPTPGATPSPTPTPGGTPSPTPTPGASPTPTPGATPSPTPVMNEFDADLTGAAINGIVPEGDAEYEIEFNNREFRVRVEEVNLPAGTPLNVLVDGVKVGTLNVAPGLDRSELRLKTEDGQAVPQINSRTRVVVTNQAGATLLAGSFSNIPQVMGAPGPAPMPTPGPGGELFIQSRLAGAAVGGLTPTGVARFRSRFGGADRKIEVEVEKVNLPAGTTLNAFVDGVKVGDLVIGPTLEARFELETERGQFVPNVTTATKVVVSNAQGQTLLSGVFNTAGLPIVAGNAVDDTTFFVEQQYRDFLGREADDPGLGYWSSEIATCNGDAACLNARRVNTSGAFFLSIEFQETGYTLYRFNKASFGTMPRRNDFLVRMQAIAQGVVVGQPGWQAKLAANKAAAAEAWVARADFQQLYGSLSNVQYVDALFNNAGVIPAEVERVALAQGLDSGAETRATVLAKVADNAEFNRREQNPAFVLMQYFGYLHRNPDEGADSDLSGFRFWLKKLEDNGGDFHKAEMVRAFIEASEYRDRFQW